MRLSLYSDLVTLQIYIYTYNGAMEKMQFFEYMYLLSPIGVIVDADET